MNRSTCLFTGIITGFFVSFMAVLLTAPTGGKEVRENLSNRMETIKTYPQAAKDRMKKREEKAYRIGKEKYERMMRDMEDIKEQARRFVIKEEMNQQ
ncbi:YtxH domain-containing protein [Aliibacillus thermotolerans]|uniref:YtxH domain-containing protein n=1 Tax=Aliibacillus thermotolerans TaxID=1834418 RepID=A0ABW0U2W1_9BACI|nr:YtxH domain-containing protein [Aliibacillus thermotolerans]MDA3129228.1 hypothetical protein [Aliibacillus thermotolerans]